MLALKIKHFSCNFWSSIILCFLYYLITVYVLVNLVINPVWFGISRCKHWWGWQLHLRQGAQHGGSALIFSLWEAQLHYNNSHYQYLTHFHILPHFLPYHGSFCRKVTSHATTMPSAPTAPQTVPWALLIGPLDSPQPQLSATRGKIELRDIGHKLVMIVSDLSYS